MRSDRKSDIRNDIKNNVTAKARARSDTYEVAIYRMIYGLKPERGVL